MTDVKYASFGSLENNCYLLTDNAGGASALIDCTQDSERMRELISGARLEYILLTHGHYDHIGGVKAISKLTGARVIIGAADAPMLSSSRLNLSAFCGVDIQQVQPDITVRDGDCIKLGESIITVLETPGHSPGSVCYLCDRRLFTGDTLFYCSCGRTDFPGGNDGDMYKSLQRLAGLQGDYKVYPGHNSLTTLDFERKNNPYIDRT